MSQKIATVSQANSEFRVSNEIEILLAAVAIASIFRVVQGLGEALLSSVISRCLGNRGQEPRKVSQERDGELRRLLSYDSAKAKVALMLKGSVLTFHGMRLLLAISTFLLFVGIEVGLAYLEVLTREVRYSTDKSLKMTLEFEKYMPYSEREDGLQFNNITNCAEYVPEIKTDFAGGSSALCAEVVKVSAKDIASKRHLTFISFRNPEPEVVGAWQYPLWLINRPITAGLKDSSSDAEVSLRAELRDLQARAKLYYPLPGEGGGKDRVMDDSVSDFYKNAFALGGFPGDFDDDPGCEVAVLQPLVAAAMMGTATMGYGDFGEHIIFLEITCQQLVKASTMASMALVYTIRSAEATEKENLAHQNANYIPGSVFELEYGLSRERVVNYRVNAALAATLWILFMIMQNVRSETTEMFAIKIVSELSNGGHLCTHGECKSAASGRGTGRVKEDIYNDGKVNHIGYISTVATGHVSGAAFLGTTKT